MKHIFLQITLFGLISFCQGKMIKDSNEKMTLECVYQFDFKTDSLSDNVRSDLQLLQISSGLSKYESKGQMKADSLLVAFSSMPFNQNSADIYMAQLSKLPSSRTTFKVCKIKSTDVIRVYDRIATKDYFYDESPLFQWKILSAKSTIAGYSCQKATTVFRGRVWEAWFTREIPVSDGPYKFKGLPGLILKVRDNRNNFKFEIVNIVKPQVAVDLLLPSVAKITKTTRQDFIRGREANRQGGLMQMSASGELILKNSEQIQRNKAIKPYNPIELK